MTARAEAALRPRPLTRRDAAAGAALHARAMSSAWDAAAWRELVEDPLIVARGIGTARRLDAAVLARCVADEAELVMVLADPGCRRRGLARTLLADVLETLAGRGARRVFLEVAADNPAAEALYRGFGFVDAGRRVGYYATPDGRADALVLVRSLPLDPAAPGS